MCSRFETASYARGRDQSSQEYLELLRTRQKWSRSFWVLLHDSSPTTSESKAVFSVGCGIGHCSASNANAIAFSLFTICWSVSGFLQPQSTLDSALHTEARREEIGERITLRFGSITNLLAVARLTVDS